MSSSQEAARVEQAIMLKDFPQTAKDVEALLRHKFDKLHSINLIEEVFNREIDSDDEATETNNV